MKSIAQIPGRGWRHGLAALALWSLSLVAAHAQDAGALRARHAAQREQLSSNHFKRPLTLESTQNANDLKGEVYAVIEQPFAVVAPALQSMEEWCDLLILHLNVKGCSTSGKAPNELLSLIVGRKFDQPLDEAYRIEFNFSSNPPGTDYFKMQMTADTGPLSTRNYRLALEAVALDAKSTFVHMSYSYAYGMAARMAMQGYLATVGRDKVGFSIVGKGDDGTPIYVDGVRGVVERNTMRYYLAIDAYLGALSSPPAEQLEKRLRDWYDAANSYPRQLHEMERNDYLAMKRREVQRQQAVNKGAKPG